MNSVSSHPMMVAAAPRPKHRQKASESVLRVSPLHIWRNAIKTRAYALPGLHFYTPSLTVQLTQDELKTR